MRWLAAFVVVAGLADASAPEFAQALQKKYDGVKDFSADFTHAYEGGVLHKKITERGRVQIKKPGKMRWEYSSRFWLHAPIFCSPRPFEKARAGHMPNTARARNDSGSRGIGGFNIIWRRWAPGRWMSHIQS